MSITASRLYGLYIHNLTSSHSDKDIAHDSVHKFLKQSQPLAYEFGDVIVLKPNNDIGQMVYDIMAKNGFMVEFIEPNQLYRLLDSMVVHYVFVDEFMEQSVVEKFIYDWEISNKLTLADLRYTRYIKTYFVKKGT